MKLAPRSNFAVRRESSLADEKVSPGFSRGKILAIVNLGRFLILFSRLSGQCPKEALEILRVVVEVG